MWLNTAAIRPGQTSRWSTCDVCSFLASLYSDRAQKEDPCVSLFSTVY